MSKPLSQVAITATFFFLIATCIIYMVSLPQTLRSLREHFENANSSKDTDAFRLEFTYLMIIIHYRHSITAWVSLGSVPSCTSFFKRSISHHFRQWLGVSLPIERWSYAISYKSRRRSHGVYASSVTLPQHYPHRLSRPAQSTIEDASGRLCRCRHVFRTASPAYNVQLWPHSRADGAD